MATPANQVYTYHYNGIGSTVAMTDQSKTIVNKYFYTPFGLLTNQIETIPQPFKYAGRYGVMHEPNGFYYMRARYYDPAVGRFISEDPIGFGGGDINLYAYVGNNPINFVDPFGLERAGIGSTLVNFIFGGPAYAEENEDRSFVSRLGRAVVEDVAEDIFGRLVGSQPYMVYQIAKPIATKAAEVLSEEIPPRGIGMRIPYEFDPQLQRQKEEMMELKNIIERSR